MSHDHHYEVCVEWTGNTGQGTRDYRAYRRDHSLSAAGKPEIPGSADPAFLGDAGRWNPEELLVAALAACHKLWYLHLCADAGITVEAYRDQARGTLRLGQGANHFTDVTLRPEVAIREPDRVDDAVALHAAAHERCFIARSMNFPVRCEPAVRVGAGPQDGPG